MRTIALYAFSVVCACAQPLTRANVAPILGFEHGRPGGTAAPWAGGPESLIDDQTFRTGSQSVRMRRIATSAGTFSSLSIAIPADF
jgi:hypothetical protein